MSLPNFLISTSRAIYLYRDKLEKMPQDHGVYFGLTKIPEIGYCALGRNNFDGTGGGNPNGVNSLEFIDKNFNHLSTVRAEFIRDGHQILYKDESIYITNTGLNCITAVHKSGKGANIQLYDELGTDVHHINSINWHDDKWYLNQHRREFGQDNGGIAIFDNNWKFLEYIEVGKHTHNCLIKDGFLWVSDSDNGQLFKINLETKDKTVFPIDQRMTRGLIITNEHLLIGLSEKDTRENRHKNKTGRIKVYLYPSMEWVHTIEIPDCGQVNDLLLL